MGALIEQRALAIGADFEPTQVAFDLSRENRPIFEAIARQTREFGATFEWIRTNIPLPVTAIPAADGHFYRLPNHNRSFCYSLSETASFIDAPVLVFKGSEPLLRDFGTLIDWMTQAPLRKSTRVMSDHFPIAEGKVPGVLTMKEALREAEIALEVQKKHLQHYAELARLPTPLLIHTFPQQQRDSCTALLRQRLSASAFDRIEPLIQNGMAIYIYYYPAPPIRSNYLSSMMASQLEQYVRTKFSEDRAVSGWVTLLVRLLYLGYFPYTVRNDGLGACMDFGNATLDGGFCDPDSIVPMEPETDDEFFREAVLQSLTILQDTVQLMLDLSTHSTLYPSVDDFACGELIRHLFRAALQSEARPGLYIDDRLKQLMSLTSIDDVKRCTTRKTRAVSYANFIKRPGGTLR